MLSFALVGLLALCILGGVAYVGGRIGYRRGATWAAREIAHVFRQEIDLKNVEERLRQSRFIDLALDRTANELLRAAIMEGARQLQAETKRIAGEVYIIMDAKELQEVAWLADTGLRAWTTEEDIPFRPGDRLPYKRAERLVAVLDKFERRMTFGLLVEPEPEKKRRLDNAENRMAQVRKAYGQDTHSIG